MRNKPPPTYLTESGKRRWSAKRTGTLLSGDISDDTEMALCAIPERAYHCFLNYGYLTVGRVRNASDDELLKLANMGAHTLRDLRAVIGYPNGEKPAPGRKIAPPGWRFFMNGACVFVGHDE